jgi:phospholipid-translocating ATPase
LIGFVLSVGGWFLWQIILSLLFKPGKSYFLYPIKDGFVYYFGRNLLWWLVLILSLASVIVLELGVKSLKKSFWPTDTDLFQQLQKDPVIRKRFEDSVNAEEKPGSSGTATHLDGGKGKTSTDIHGEREIQELLSRPRIMPIGMDGADAEVVRSPVETVDLNGHVQRTASGNHLTRRKISMDHGNDGYEAVTGELSPRKGSNVKTRHSIDIAEVLRRKA